MEDEANTEEVAIEDASMEVESQELVQEAEEKAIKQDYIIWLIALFFIFILVKMIPAKINKISSRKKRTYKKESKNIVDGQRTLKL